MPAPWFTQSTNPPLESGEIVLAAHAAAAADARQFTASLLGKWGLEEHADNCTVVVSELITNALTAVGGLTVPSSGGSTPRTRRDTVVLKLVRTADFLVVEVWDSSQDVPVPAHPDEGDEDGRGLMLVDALTDDWDYYHSPDGTTKAVWGRLPLPPTQG